MEISAFDLAFDAYDDLRDCLPPPELDSGELESDRADGWEILSGPHPILQLPPEVLSEIFIECLPQYSAAPASTRAPMLLAAICRDWREIALSTPFLWSSFILSVNLLRAKDGSSVVRLFETWISRSGSCPLTMVINSVFASFSMNAAPVQHTLPESFISALNRCSSRWHDVNFMLPLTDFYRLQADEGLPLLRRLSITAAPNTASVESESPLPPLKLFSIAPLLRDISLGPDFTPHNVILPLHQLTYFDSRASTSIAHCLDVARGAPGLMELRLDLHTLENWSPVRTNIKTLNIFSVMWGNNVLDVLDCMTCPALETLVVHGSVAMSALPLHRFLSRSSPSLRELSLDCLLGPSDALVETVPCLIALPTLAHLNIRPLAGATAHDIFSRMCDPTSPFLPRLQTLRVQVNVGEAPRMSWTYGTMTRMLVARWNKRAGDDVDQLRVFTFSFSGSSGSFGTDPFAQPDGATLEQLERLAEQGMDIELVTERQVNSEDFWSDRR